jgi:hypothetical protein
MDYGKNKKTVLVNATLERSFFKAEPLSGRDIE